jgi:hypothetical protein
VGGLCWAESGQIGQHPWLWSQSFQQTHGPLFLSASRPHTSDYINQGTYIYRNTADERGQSNVIFDTSSGASKQ